MRGPQRGPDRVAKPQFRPETPSAGDRNDLVGAPAQFVANIVDDELEVAGFADDARQVLPQDRLSGGEDRRLDAAHPFAPARRRRQVFEFEVEVAHNSAAARHRSKPVEPERRASGQFAHRAERDQPVEQPPRAALRYSPADFGGRARGNPRRAALPAPPEPPWRAISAGPPAAFAPAARARPKGRTRAPPPWRRRTRLRPRRRRRIARRARPGAGEQRRGEQRQGERPFEALRQHAIGEPRREQLALPSPAAQGLAPGALRQGAPREGKDLRRGERRRSIAPARLGGVDRLLQRLVVRDPQDLGGGGEKIAANALSSGRRAPARRGAAVPRARDRRPDG